jgi:hypothetical protein
MTDMTDLAPDPLADARVAALIQAATSIAREMDFMLRHNPDKDGGMYRDALTETQAALAALSPTGGKDDTL